MMQIGAMNHPGRDLLDELRWISDARLDFVDLTLEPPSCACWQIDFQAIRTALSHLNLGAVGHTAYYLPIGHPFEAVRQAAVGALLECMRAFVQLGIRWMNVHPDGHAPFHDRSFVIGQNIASLQTLIDFAKPIQMGVMIENIPEGFNSPEQLGELLDPLPELGLHLDIGHANLRVPKNTAESILDRFGDRVRHVHLHDNRGDIDSHLPLGAGTIEWQRIVRSLRHVGYDGTITLEVFTPNRDYLLSSRDQLRKLLDEW